MEKIITEMGWEDLVLPEKTLEALKEIESGMKLNNNLFTDWQMKSNLKSGKRLLFYGPPGTGKTLTAALLGKNTGRDVFKINLSTVISKYIGETEKNLDKLFKMVEDKPWILFFDEADALFGKRIGVSDAHDRYANQEIAYFLKKTENYPGVVILSSNSKSKMNSTFLKRFQSVIHFQKPHEKERYSLWKKYFSASLETDHDLSFRDVAKKYKITGGNIVNAIRNARLKATEMNSKKIKKEYLIDAIKKEMMKT